MNKGTIFLLSFLGPFGGSWMATQSLAEKVHYDVQFLGEPLLTMSGSPVYGPFQIFSWYRLYHPYIPHLFQSSLLWIFGGALLMLAILFLFRPKAPLTSHGSARWAKYPDLLKMDLISGSGVVIGLYDSSWKRNLTKLLRKLEIRKKEKESFAEMDFDKKRDKKLDKEAEKLAHLRAKFDETESASMKHLLQKAIATEEAKVTELSRSYDAKKDDKFTYYFYSLPYKKCFSWYTHLSHFYLRDNSNKHLAVIAPTRSGKGVGLIVPTLLGGWKASTIVNDIKSENWGITAGYRHYRMGQKTIKFEPTADDGSSARWNPLDEIRIGDPMEVSMAQNLAAVLADYEGKGKPDHWTANAANVIMAVILHLKYAHFSRPDLYPNPPNLYTVASFLKAVSAPTMKEDDEGNSYYDEDEISVQDFVTAIQTLTGFEHVPKDGIEIDEWDTKACRYVKRRFTPDDLHKLYPGANFKETPYTHPIVGQAFIEISKKPDNELGSIVSTANTALKEYLDPVLSMNTSVSDFCIDDIMNYKKPVSLYLVTPPSDLLRLAPIFRLFFEMMVRHHARIIGEYKNGQAKAKYKHKCLFLMDEFSSLGNLQSFAATLSYIAGYGMKVFLINQGLPQINGIYGKDNQILMNCHLQIFYAPNDNDTGKYAEQLLGNETIEVESESKSDGQGFFGNTSHSTSQTGRALMTADELKRLGDQEIIAASGSPPVLTDKIKYYENKFFTKKLMDAPPVSDVIRVDKEHNANPKREAKLRALREAKKPKKAPKAASPDAAPSTPALHYQTIAEQQQAAPPPAFPATFYQTLRQQQQEKAKQNQAAPPPSSGESQ